MNKEYHRDGRSPIPKNETTSRVMSANKSKNTKPEIKLRQALWHTGLRGYRLHPKKTPGRPDIVFNKQKVAIFVNGCYWHRCEKCNPNFPKSNQKFWREKFQKNKERDKNKLRELASLGWVATTIWECEIKNDLNKCVQKINNCLNSNKKRL